jgi:hypothetical protein
MHLLQTLDPKARVRQLLDVDRQRTVIGVLREPLGRPGLPVPVVEQVVRDGLDMPAVARMDDREDEPAAVSEHSRDGAGRRVQVGDVHERHVADNAVEALVRESGELVRVAFHVGDAPRSRLLVPARVSEHLRRHVDGRHTSA